LPKGRYSNEKKQLKWARHNLRNRIEDRKEKFSKAKRKLLVTNNVGRVFGYTLQGNGVRENAVKDGGKHEDLPAAVSSD